MIINIFEQLIYILFFSLLGEYISSLIPFPIPGSVIGMILLFISLELKWVKLEKIEAVGNFLVTNLAILFVAAGVGIMTKVEYIKDIWVSFFVICIASTAISVAISSLVVKYIKNKFESGESKHHHKHHRKHHKEEKK